MASGSGLGLGATNAELRPAMGLMCLLATLYELHVRDSREHMASWTYGAGSLGVIYAGDLLTLFLFRELMALSSVFLWFRRRPESLAAGFRYLLARKYGLHMGIDLAFGPDDPVRYVVFGSAWMRP